MWKMATILVPVPNTHFAQNQNSHASISISEKKSETRGEFSVPAAALCCFQCKARPPARFQSGYFSAAVPATAEQ
jgi:hypothetical protein